MADIVLRKAGYTVDEIEAMLPEEYYEKVYILQSYIPAMKLISGGL